MDLFVRSVALLSRACGVVAAVMLALAVLVVCQMVWVRYVLEASSSWQTEFVTYILIAATFVGSPYVLLLRGHVNVDLLPIYLGRRGRFALAFLSYTLSLAFCLLIAWLGYDLWKESWDRHWLSDTVWEVRLWIPYLAMPVGFGILSLQYVADIACLVTGREAPFGMAEEGE